MKDPTLPFNVVLNAQSPEPLFRQLAQQIRTAILEGQLKQGVQLPPTRRLADELGVSRATVIEAYRVLAAQTLLEAGQGSGSRVAPNAAITPNPAVAEPKETPLSSARVSKYATRIAAIGPMHEDNPYITTELNFGGVPPELLPITAWRQLMSKYGRSLDSGIFDPWHDPLGFAPLREALAAYVTRSRGVVTTPDRIAVFSGYQPALECLTRVLVDAGDTVAVENPGYIGAGKTFEYQGASIVTIDSDRDGMLVHKIEEMDTPPKVIFATPSLQDPTGVSLNAERRKSLLNFAAKNEIFIVEDDYDSEYRYGSKAVPALQSLDSSDRVIYLGNFRKMLYPLVRLAFVVLPKQLVRYVELAKSSVERDLPIVEQCVLSEFIETGTLERHVQKVRATLNERRQTLVRELTKRFGKAMTISRENSGTHLMVHFHSPFSDDEILQFAKESNANLVSFSAYFVDGRPTPGQFLWSFLSGTNAEIELAVERMAEKLKAER